MTYETRLREVVRGSHGEWRRSTLAMASDWFEWRGLTSCNAEHVIHTGHVGPGPNTGAPGSQARLRARDQWIASIPHGRLPLCCAGHGPVDQ